MKIVNIVDLNLVKIFLSKFYLAHGLDYLFIVPHKETIEKQIPLFQPDLILLQHQYSEVPIEDIVAQVRSLTPAPIAVFFLRSDKETVKRISALGKKGKDLFFYDKHSFAQEFEELLTRQANGISREQVAAESEVRHSLLFADDSAVMRHFVRRALADRPITLHVADDGAEAWDLYQEHLPNLVITDIEMPRMDGLQLCKKIKENNQGRFIPVIILSNKKKPIDIDTAFDIGADDYLTKPTTTEEFNHKIDEYLSVLDRKQRNKILLADDSKVSSEIITHALVKNSLQVLHAVDGETAFDIAVRERPDIIITDIEMPRLNGYELAKKVRQHPDLKETSLIMMSARDRRSDIKKGEKLGISRYFIKPFDVEKLVIVVEQLLLEKYNIYQKEYEYMLSTIQSLITALEARDHYTKGHTQRVSAYASRLGRFIGLSSYALKELEIGSNLHDVGKIGVRDDILLKPGRLSAEEYAKIQEHAIIGAEILRPLRLLENIIPLILFHHERWDGRGYPSMIHGDKIPLGARIIAIADTYDAITSDRPYRKALSQEDALQIIRENLGKQFCPETGKAFLAMMETPGDPASK